MKGRYLYLAALAFSVLQGGVAIEIRQEAATTELTPTTVLPSCTRTPTSVLNFEDIPVPPTTTSVPLPSVYHGLKITSDSAAIVNVTQTGTDPFSGASQIRAFVQTKPNILYIPSGSISFEPADDDCYFGTWTYRWAYPDAPMNLTVASEYDWANETERWELDFPTPGNTGTLNWREPASVYFMTRLSLEAKDPGGGLVPFYMDDIWPGFRCGCDGDPYVDYN
ncbi:hypothetical protein RUND412_003850 [Rhizina undulata]